MSKQNLQRLAQDYLYLKEEIKKREAMLADLKKNFELELKRRKAESLKLGKFNVKVTKVTRKSLDTELLKAEKPKIFNAYQKQIEYNQLNVTVA